MIIWLTNDCNYYYYNFSENIFLIYNAKTKNIFTLYDISDINNIKYQNLIYGKIEFKNYGPSIMYSKQFQNIKTLSEGKMIVIFFNYILIYKFEKHLQILTQQMKQQMGIYGDKMEKKEVSMPQRQIDEEKLYKFINIEPSKEKKKEINVRFIKKIKKFRNLLFKLIQMKKFLL